MSTFGQMNSASNVQPEINLQAMPKTALVDSHSREDKQGHLFFLMVRSSLHKTLKALAKRLTILRMAVTVPLEQQQGPVKGDSLLQLFSEPAPVSN